MPPATTTIANPQTAWIHDLISIAAIDMPEPWADEFGTTVNGMWADPEKWTTEAVAAAHAKGRRILVSVPLIALTHEFYERPELAYLLDEVCLDIDGGQAEVDWYYWDAKPVWSLCVFSPVLRTYLVDRLQPAIAAGVDVVNIDEINTSVGLMTRDPKGSGYCRRCIGGSPVIADEAQRRAVTPSDVEVRSWLREDPDLYRRYATELQERAFGAAAALIEEVRAIARNDGRATAITANTAGFGAFVGTQGPLWSPMWGELLDVIMLEGLYIDARGRFDDPHPHKLLPRGTFAPVYQLGRAIGPRAPIWIAPQINVPKQLAGQQRQRYYELMFLEAYANLGRWGYYWWPGVDATTRRAATAPDVIKDWTVFLRAHEDLYVRLATDNRVAIVYANSALIADPDAHYLYLGVAQAMYEAGIQYDVLFTGDDRFVPAPLDPLVLSRYRTVIVPSIDLLTPTQDAAVEAYRAGGGEVRGIATGSAQHALVDRFWSGYADTDRAAVVAALALDASDAIDVTASRVVPIRYVDGQGKTLVHLLDYDYRDADDRVEPVRDLTVRLPWAGSTPFATLVSRTGTGELAVSLDGGRLGLTISELRDHAVVVLSRSSDPSPRGARGV